MFQALTYEMSFTYESPHEVHSYMRAGTTARRLGKYCNGFHTYIPRR